MNASSKRVYFHICLFAFVVITCNALGHHHCQYIENRRYDDGETIYEYSCQNTSEVKLYNHDGEFIGKDICIQRAGPFTVYIREPLGLYSCFIDPVVDKSGQISKGFGTDFTSTCKPCCTQGHYESEPDVCTVCSGEFFEGTFVAHEKLWEKASRIPYPPMPCNRPSFCPDTDDPLDKRCIGGEYRFFSNRENCCKDGKRRRRKSHSRRYRYGYRG